MKVVYKSLAPGRPPSWWIDMDNEGYLLHVFETKEEAVRVMEQMEARERGEPVPAPVAGSLEMKRLPNGECVLEGDGLGEALAAIGLPPGEFVTARNGPCEI